jgi:hypothetical protein
MNVKIVVEALHFLMAHGTKPNPHLGQSPKRGFIGPSICHLCQQNEEST